MGHLVAPFKNIAGCWENEANQILCGGIQYLVALFFCRPQNQISGLISCDMPGRVFYCVLQWISICERSTVEKKRYVIIAIYMTSWLYEFTLSQLHNEVFIVIYMHLWLFSISPKYVKLVDFIANYMCLTNAHFWSVHFVRCLWRSR